MNTACEECAGKGYARCWCNVSVAAPLECVPCRYCGKRDEMYAELPEQGDWNGRGFVMRIGCTCDPAREADPDGYRTEFETYSEAIAFWNAMQSEAA